MGVTPSGRVGKTTVPFFGRLVIVIDHLKIARYAGVFSTHRVTGVGDRLNSQARGGGVWGGSRWFGDADGQGGDDFPQFTDSNAWRGPAIVASSKRSRLVAHPSLELVARPSTHLQVFEVVAGRIWSSTPEDLDDLSPSGEPAPVAAWEDGCRKDLARCPAGPRPSFDALGCWETEDHHCPRERARRVAIRGGLRRCENG